MKPGSMETKATWMFALGAGILAGVVQLLGLGIVGLLLLAVGGFLSTFMTKASKGLGIGAGFVASILYCVFVAIATMNAADAAMAEASAGMTGTDAQVASAVGDGIGFIGAVIGSIVSLVIGFIIMLVTSLIGAVARPKQAEQQPAVG